MFHTLWCLAAQRKGMVIKMKGLLDELAQKYHAAYLSDLRLNHRINDCVVRELYLFPNKQNYSLWEWSDAVSYLLKRNVSFASYEEVDNMLKGLYNT